MITWNHIIRIILEMFDSINQQQLARLLHISESTLSKIKSGKQNGSFNSEVVFDAVFNPDTPASPANDSPAFHLGILKDIINKQEYKEVKKGVEDFWNEENYQIFVTKLLGRTRNNSKNNGISDRSTDGDPYGQSSDCILPLKLADDVDNPSKGEKPIRSIILPHSDDCCYHCKYWNGDRQTFGGYTTSTYGHCTKYNRDKQLSSAMPCEDFEKREKQVGEW